jgi:hypothetical protein
MRAMTILYSNQQLVPPTNSHLLKKALKAELVVLEGLGHMIHSEDPQAFNALVEKHVEKALQPRPVDPSVPEQTTPTEPKAPNDNIPCKL